MICMHPGNCSRQKSSQGHPRQFNDMPVQSLVQFIASVATHDHRIYVHNNKH